MNCKVLWIDDEYDNLGSFRFLAKSKGIILNPFRSLESGMAELKKNYSQYDAVLLDAKFYDKDYQLPGSQSIENAIKAQREILQLPVKLGIFLLTGQTDVIIDSTFKLIFEKIYKKGNDSDNDSLFRDIKEYVLFKEDHQLITEYKSAFLIFENGHLKKGKSDLLSLLKNTEEANNFNLIRIIIENLFKALAEINIIPKELIDKQGWINGSARFLSARHEDYEFNEPDFIHPTIKTSLWQTLRISQDGSHAGGDLLVFQFSSTYKTGFLYKSTLYGLLEILAYFNTIFEENQDIERNKSRWKKIEQVNLFPEVTLPVDGSIYQDMNGNYYYKKFIFPFSKINEVHKVGQKVQILKIDKNTSPKTSVEYPYFVVFFKAYS